MLGGWYKLKPLDGHLDGAPPLRWRAADCTPLFGVIGKIAEGALSPVSLIKRLNRVGTNTNL